MVDLRFYASNQKQDLKNAIKNELNLRKVDVAPVIIVNTKLERIIGRISSSISILKIGLSYDQDVFKC